jgi:glycine dehydrogenase subunit 2
MNAKDVAPAAEPRPRTFSGDRGLDHEEPLLFELGAPQRSGVDLPQPGPGPSRLGGLERRQAIGLPGLAEPQVVRHFVRLSSKNYGIDAGIYPLGSCTMKHNPRLNEKLARLDGFADLHPLQPQATVQGALELIAELARWLATLPGMPGVAMSPGAGAHGELCGLMTIRAALEDPAATASRRSPGTNAAGSTQGRSRRRWARTWPRSC